MRFVLVIALVSTWLLSCEYEFKPVNYEYASFVAEDSFNCREVEYYVSRWNILYISESKSMTRYSYVVIPNISLRILNENLKLFKSWLIRDKD